jgi:predicted 3-demethylubiquinone-9 3-methyltransferase (glyoxalase superfamily)
MQKIVPCLWFDKNAEEAMNFYVDVFNGSPGKSAESKIVSIRRYEKGMNTPGMPEMEGQVLTGMFELDGQEFMCLDGGKQDWNFNEAVSMVVECQDQAEIDYFVEKLSAVPEAEICGWLKDKYGFSWQINPKNMDELVKTTAQINAMLEMKKIIIADLEAAGR